MFAIDKKMKIKFIYPKFDKFLETYPQLAEFPGIASAWSYRMPPSLGIPTLISMLPADAQWDVQDENIEAIIFDDDSDLIALSFFTPQSAYAYRLGDEFLKRGKPVIMGGMHPSMIPEDCSPHCTSICIGEAENIFPIMLNDFFNSQLKPLYKADTQPSSEEIVEPRKGIFDIQNKYDWHASLVSISRGCRFGCDWCNIPIYQGNVTRLRPIDNVVNEISKLAGQEFYITDDTIMLNRPKIQRYMKELFERIEQYDVKLFLSGSPAMNIDPEYLDAAARAGATSMYTVFASDPISARFYNRHEGIWKRTISLVKMLEDRGIRFFGSFGLGFDCMFEDQFDLILEFCEKADVKTAEFFIATPFPNTPFWKEIEKEKRFILPRDWSKYNCANVVFKPRHISVQQLADGFIYVWKEFYKNRNHEETLAPFQQKAENILKSRQYTQNVKDAVACGLARSGSK
jgi:radical SAM superfamily enzyme YgiQ (UPF0313 family)